MTGEAGPPAADSRKSFDSFRAFYPYYLAEHANPTCRALHYVGTTLVLVVIASAVLSGRPALLWLAPLAGYGFAWAGHALFEHNRPATFTHPFYSLAADFVMFFDALSGRLGRRLARPDD